MCVCLVETSIIPFEYHDFCKTEVSLKWVELAFMVNFHVYYSMLGAAYPEDALHNVCLMGLHTCGDLSATTLRLYSQCPTLQCLVQVGCCYHLMEEEFIRSPYWKDVDLAQYEQGYGFPLSEHLRRKKFFLGRNVRMSGTQSPERVIDLKQVTFNSSFDYCYL